MTLQQGLAFGLIAGTIVAFVWGRWRYDVIALTSLLVGVVIGVVPAKAAFDGFRNDITVIIACALVVSAAFARSGIVEALLRPLLPRLTGPSTQAPFFATAVALLSMVTKNVGALAIMMPIALQAARRTGTSPSRLLMPMSFAALLGGTVTLVGTSPNIIVSEVRQQILGQPFGMYDYAPVGLGLTAAGLVFLAFAYRLLPRNRVAVETMEAAIGPNSYFTEAVVPEGWGLETLRVSELRAMSQGDVAVAALQRAGKRRAAPHPNTIVRPGDVLLLEGEHQALDDLIARAKLKITGSDRPFEKEEPTEEVRIVEAVVGPESLLVGRSAKQEHLHGEHGINLLAVSRSGYRMSRELRTVQLRAGDMVVVQGGERTLPAP